MLTYKALLELIGREWLDWKSKRGLLLWLLIMYGAIFSVCNATIEPANMRRLTELALGLLATLAFVPIWAKSSGRLGQLNGKKLYTIAFCIDSRSYSAHSFIHEVARRLTTQFEAQGLAQYFAVHIIGPRIVTTNEEAVEYVHAHRVHLLIWGPAFVGKVDGHDHVELRLQLTSPIPPKALEAINRQPFLAAFGLAGIGRQSSYSVDALRDQETCSSELYEAVLFFSGVTICHVENGYESALPVLEQLMSQYQQQLKHSAEGNPENRQLSAIRRNHAVGFLLGAYFSKALAAYQSQQYEDALRSCGKFHGYSPDHFDVLTLEAVCHYQVGNISASRDCATKLLSLKPDAPVAHFDCGFLALNMRDYSTALKHYRWLARKTLEIPGNVVSQVVEFLHGESQKEPKRIEYRFALGIVETFHADRELGLTELSHFISQAKSRRDLAPLVQFAANIVASAKSTSKNKSRKMR